MMLNTPCLSPNITGLAWGPTGGPLCCVVLRSASTLLHQAVPWLYHSLLCCTVLVLYPGNFGGLRIKQGPDVACDGRTH